jgi:hypothetical protein
LADGTGVVPIGNGSGGGVTFIDAPSARIDKSSPEFVTEFLTSGPAGPPARHCSIGPSRVESPYKRAWLTGILVEYLIPIERSRGCKK